MNEFENYFPKTAEPQAEAVAEKTLKYNLTAPKIDDVVIEKATKTKEAITEKGRAKICLMGGVLVRTTLEGRVLTDEKFLAVDSEIEIAVKPLEKVNLQHSQIFNLLAEPLVKELRIEAVTEFNQVAQGKSNSVIVSTIDHKGQKSEREIKGIFNDEKGVFVYPVNEKITFDKAIYYSLLSEISVNVEVVY